MHYLLSSVATVTSLAIWGSCIFIPISSADTPAAFSSTYNQSTSDVLTDHNSFFLWMSPQAKSISKVDWDVYQSARQLASPRQTWDVFASANDTSHVNVGSGDGGGKGGSIQEDVDNYRDRQ